MSDLNWATVVDGKLAEKTTDTEKTNKSSKSGTNSLGKDAFLQLLVCQLQNQDPLNPASDTEFISQLATFSQLEQMQNLNSAYSSTQAFSLIGKNVVVNAEDANGNSITKEGIVDFVTIKDGKAQLSIGGELYSIDDLKSVKDDTYVLKENAPTVEALEAEYDVENPTEIYINFDWGKGSSTATQMAVLVGDTVIDSSYLDVKDNVLIIKQGALDNFTNGKKEITIAFNDKLETSINDKVTVTIYNSKATNDNANNNNQNNTEE